MERVAGKQEPKKTPHPTENPPWNCLTSPFCEMKSNLHSSFTENRIMQLIGAAG